MTRSINDKESTNKDPADLIAGYVLGNLTDKEAEHFQQQLSEQPGLLRELAAFQEAADLIPHALPKVDPPANLKSRLLATANELKANELTASGLTASEPPTNQTASAHIIPRAKSSIATDASIGIDTDAAADSRIKDSQIGAQRSHSIPVQNTRPKRASQLNSRLNSKLSDKFDQQLSRWLSNSLLTGISTAVAAVSIAAVVITSGKLSEQTRQTASLQQQIDTKTAEIASLRTQLQETQAVTAFLGERATQVHALVDAKGVSGIVNNPETDSKTILPTARLLAKAGEREIVFVAQDLPQLPSEQIYRLWAVADEAADPMYCGQFRQDDSGTARWQAPNVACTNAPVQLLITLDAPDDPITSAGPLVLQTRIESEI